ncbi:hypothetical protein U876_07660 [Aeromonas hydrophila NJ-35]|nr:hypothetical protein V428_15425 [Aeromonas hydrophila subsp. hydrophila AL09-71]AHX70209.1 hypothetical protein V429_15450 [Aeromonas hydrophila pc104A]AJE38594.1 hypothetical protein V469_07690 [Aeromonas hydrophila J-1]AKJ37009.1 hypothetical protein U876_07660 [Aeromonas hydrophila NJ-35]ALQ62823.1 hypothetical protein AS145_07945 [Aeromonas hydrophila]
MQKLSAPYPYTIAILMNAFTSKLSDSLSYHAMPEAKFYTAVWLEYATTKMCFLRGLMVKLGTTLLELSCVIK